MREPVPGELIITSFPDRTGLYLAIMDGIKVKPVARFVRGEESAQEFVAWAKKAGVRYEGKEV